MARCLSVHAGYRCAHSGVCCRTRWNIPFSEEERVVVEALRLVSPGLVEQEGVVLADRRPDGSCVFLDREAHRCAIHRAAGPDAPPLSCRMFPRVVLHDARGTFVSLSHHCPTAAGLLFAAAGPLTIVDAPPQLIQSGALDGLDARNELPPLLRPDVLMDLDSYALWEEQAIGLIAEPDGNSRAAIDRLREVTDSVVAWRPGAGWLSDRIESAFAAGAGPSGRQTAVESPESRAVKRWLAARLFGTWIAYQGRGLGTIVRYLYLCLDTFEAQLARDGDTREAIRRSDYWLVHARDSQDLARELDRSSARDPRPSVISP